MLITNISSRWRSVVQIALGTGILQASSIVTYVVLARLLEPTDYGTYRQLFLVNQITWGVLFAALPTSLLYFYGATEDGNGKDAAINHHLFLTALGGLVAISLLLLMRNTIATALANKTLVGLLQIYAAYPIAFAINQMIPPILVCKKRSDLMPVFTGTAATATALITLTTAAVSRDLQSVVLAVTVSTVATAIFGLLITFRLAPFSTPNWESLRKISVYCWPIAIATGISIVGLKLDHVAVSNLFGPSLYAIYAVGALEIPIYSLVRSSSTSVILPIISEHASAADWDAVIDDWQDILRKNVAMLFPISATLYAFSDETIAVLFGNKYQAAAAVFAAFALLGPVRSMSFNMILRAMGRTKPDLIGAILFFGLVGGLIVPITRGVGVIGAAYTVIATTYLIAVLLLVLTAKASQWKLPLTSLMPVRLIGIFAFLLMGFSALSSILENILPSSILRLGVGGAVALGLTRVLLSRQNWIIPSRRLHTDTAKPENDS